MAQRASTSPHNRSGVVAQAGFSAAKKTTMRRALAGRGVANRLCSVTGLGEVAALENPY